MFEVDMREVHRIGLRFKQHRFWMAFDPLVYRKPEVLDWLVQLKICDEPYTGENGAYVTESVTSMNTVRQVLEDPVYFLLRRLGDV